MFGGWRNEVRVKAGPGEVGLGSAWAKYPVSKALAASGVGRMMCWRVQEVTMLEVS